MTASFEDLTLTLTRLRVWFAEGRAVFERRDPTRVPILDAMLADAERCLQPERQLPICFLGNAGVGKSTLINSLVDPLAHVVPQGGVGPLTAQATVVRYADRPYLSAKYYGARRVNQLAFALDRYSERRQRRAIAEDNAGLDAETRNEVLFALSPGDDASDEVHRAIEARARAYVAQARLLVTGGQFGDDSDDEIGYLADMLRASLGRIPLWGSACRPEDEPHLTALRAAIARGDSGLEMVAEDDRSSFLIEVRRHATGSLAPLIKSLEVGWRAEVLRDGLTLVDLPGVGVANDEYRSVTSEWIRRASAIVLVVDRAGVTEASADLLRITGFLNALLHRAPDAIDVSPLLWVAAVKLDDVAGDERESYKQQHPGEHLPRWIEFFQRCCDDANALIRRQLALELEKMIANTPDELRGDRAAAQARVLDQLEVHALSAAQYRRLCAQDEDAPARIKTADESNVPRLASAMRDLARRHSNVLVSSATRAIASLVASIHRGAIGIAEDLEGADQVGRLEVTRQLLAGFIAPRERALALRQGQLRERLRETIPATIKHEVNRGVMAADTSARKYLVSLQRKNWSTLRAAIRRGGIRLGPRALDIPNELALKLEEPLAPIWNRSVVENMKAAINGFGQEVRRTMDEVVAWAQAPEAQLDARRVERYRDDTAADLARLSDVATASAAALRESAKLLLHQTMENTIRVHCVRFVESGKDTGTGVKNRQIEFLRDLSDVALREAAKTATRFLLNAYEHVVKRVSAEFAPANNALTHAQTLLLGEPQLADPGRLAEARQVRALIARIPTLAQES